MTISYIHHRGNPRLILIFAGWSMDENPFTNLHREDCDIAVVYDYTDSEHIDGTMPESGDYEEICVIAWSYGVVPAAMFILAHPELPITLKTAVNGTHFPVDDRRGIPERIFNGTMESLSDFNLTRFHRRMCGGANAYAEFANHLPHRRDIDKLRGELRAIATLPHISPKEVNWDRVIVSRSDMIIPASNQLEAWKGHPMLKVTEGQHLPDFETIIETAVSCKPLIADRFSKATSSYDNDATVQAQTARYLAELTVKSTGTESRRDTIEIGAGTGVFTRAYLKAGINPGHLELWDLAYISPELPGKHIICDGETALMRREAESADLILTASTVQWFNSPATFIQNCARVLRKGGIVAIATYGPDTFSELNLATPAHYLSTEAWQKIIPRQMSVEFIGNEKMKIGFDTPRQLLEHIRRTGVNATAERMRITAARRVIAEEITTLTYESVYILLRKQ